MRSFTELIQAISRLLEWWVIVNPWEQAIFVRLGKNQKVLGPGIYFKIPFLDRVFIQSNRIRMIDGSMQTLTTKDNYSITMKISLSYSISDISKLYQKLSHPETTLIGEVMSVASEYVYSKNLKDIDQKEMIKEISDNVSDFYNFGLADIKVHLLTFSNAKVFRLIQDPNHLYRGEDIKMNEIK